MLFSLLNKIKALDYDINNSLDSVEVWRAN